MLSPKDLEILQRANEHPYTESDLQWDLFHTQIKNRTITSGFTSELARSQAYYTGFATTTQDIVDRNIKGLSALQENTTAFISMHPREAKALQGIYYDWLTRNLLIDDKDRPDPNDFENILPQEVLNGYITSHMSEESLKHYGFGTDKNMNIYEAFSRDFATKYDKMIDRKTVQALAFAKRINNETLFNAYMQNRDWIDSGADMFLGFAGKVAGDLTAGSTHEHLYVGLKDLGVAIALYATQGRLAPLLPEVSVGTQGAEGVTALFNIAKSGTGWFAKNFGKNLALFVPLDAVSTVITNEFGDVGNIFSNDEKVGLKEFVGKELEQALVATGVEGGGLLAKAIGIKVAKYGGGLVARFAGSTLPDSVLKSVAEANGELGMKPYEPTEVNPRIRAGIELGDSTEDIFKRYMEDNPHDGSVMDIGNLTMRFAHDFNMAMEDLGKDNPIKIDREFFAENFENLSVSEQTDAVNAYTVNSIINRALQINPSMNPTSLFSILETLNQGADGFSRNKNAVLSMISPFDEKFYKMNQADKDAYIREWFLDKERMNKTMGRPVDFVNSYIENNAKKQGRIIPEEDKLKSDYITQIWNKERLKDPVSRDEMKAETFGDLDKQKMNNLKNEFHFEDKIKDEDKKAKIKKILEDKGVVFDRKLSRWIAENPQTAKDLLAGEEGLFSLRDIRKYIDLTTRQEFSSFKEFLDIKNKERAEQLKEARSMASSVMKSMRDGGHFDFAKVSSFARKVGVDAGYRDSLFKLLSALSKDKAEFEDVLKSLGFDNPNLRQLIPRIGEGVSTTVLEDILDKYPVREWDTEKADTTRAFSSLLREAEKGVEDITRLRGEALTEASEGIRKQIDKDINDIFRNSLDEGHAFYQAQKKFNANVKKEIDGLYKSQLGKGLKAIDAKLRSDLEARSLKRGIIEPTLRKLDKSLSLGDEEYADVVMDLIGEGDERFQELNKQATELRSSIAKEEKIQRKRLISAEAKQASAKRLNAFRKELDAITIDNELLKSASDLNKQAIADKENFKKQMDKRRDDTITNVSKKEIPENLFPLVKKEFAEIRREVNKFYKIEHAKAEAEINESFKQILQDANDHLKNVKSKIKDIQTAEKSVVEKGLKASEDASKRLEKEKLQALKESRNNQRRIAQDAITATKNRGKFKAVEDVINTINEMLENTPENYNIDDYEVALGQLGKAEFDEDHLSGGSSLFPRRLIHFLDETPEHRQRLLEIYDKWGDVPIGTGLFERMKQNLSTKYGQLQYFGMPKDGMNFHNMAEMQKKNLDTLLSLSNLNRKNLPRWVDYKLKQLENNIDYVANGGYLGGVQGKMWIGQTLGRLASMANLANLFKTASIFDGISFATHASLNDRSGIIGFTKYLGEYWGNVLSKFDRRDMETLAYAVDEFSRNHMHIAEKQLQNSQKELSKFGKFNAKMLNYMDRGFEFYTQSKRLVNIGQRISRLQILDMMAEPNEFIKNKWGAMHGILDSDWAFLRENATIDSNGRPVLTSIIDTNVGQRFLRVLDEEARYMIPVHSQRFRASVASTGAFADMLIRNVTYLKGIPFVEMKDKWKNLYYETGMGRTAIIASGLMASTLSTVIGNLLVGRKTDLTKPDQWHTVIANMPVSGVFGDMFTSYLLQGGYQGNARVASLLFGQYDFARDFAFNDIQKIAKGNYHWHDAMRLNKKINPIARMPATSILFDRWITDNIIATLDPEGFAYMRKINKLDDERGNPRYWRK